MEVVISNNKLEVKIGSLGAELISLKDAENNKEYMWQKNPEFWNKCSPVLFPFIGALKDNQYFYENEKYSFPNKHGFAREREFKLISHNESSAEFLLSYDEKTLELYPFKFNFYMKYTLKERVLGIEYRVENLENKKMYFSLGNHPAFNTPTDENTSFTDYYIEFEKSETGEGYILENSLFKPENKKIYFKENILNLDEELFVNDIVIFTNVNSQKVYLKNKKTDFCLGFTYKGFKHIGFWKKPNAPYVCFEAWNGLPDYITHLGNLENKTDIEVLDEKSVYTKNIEIEIF